MKTPTTIILAMALAMVGFASPLRGQGTAFSYQGQLMDNGQSASGGYNLSFQLYDAPTGGNVVGASTVITNLAVSNGLFTVELDFGSEPFTGRSLWLQLQVKPPAATDWEPLSPRQPLTPAPYALHARSVDSAGIADGTVTGDQLVDGTVRHVDVDDASFATTFWRAQGNAGTTPGEHFVGTTDDRPLEFKVDGTRALRLEPVTGSPNVVGGYLENFIRPGVAGGVIGGGGRASQPNTVAGDFGAVLGGAMNRAGDEDDQPALSSHAVVSGGLGNQALGPYSISAGGRGNAAANAYTFVGGGSSNLASGFAAAIGGGANHEAAGNSSTVSGGWDNTASGEYSVVPGGLANVAGGRYALAAGQRAHAEHEGSFVWADSATRNFASTGPDQFAIRASGGLKLASADPGNPPHMDAWESDHFEVRVEGRRAMQLLTVPDVDAALLGSGEEGYSNAVNVVLGGPLNEIAANVSGATIGGGGAFRYRASFGSLDVDELANRASADFATVSGGLGNEADEQGTFGAIGGGWNNDIRAYAATIGGGSFNTVYPGANYGTIAGGYANRIESFESTIGGGEINSIGTNAILATISGGIDNRIEGAGGTIGGGGIVNLNFYSSNSYSFSYYGNHVGGFSATVPGGAGNSALGNFSFAAGYRAQALHDGAFVWADSRDQEFSSSGPDQFRIRARGGVIMPGDTSVFFGNQTRQMLNLYNTTYGIGVQDFTLYMRSNSDFSWFKGGTHSNTNKDAGPGGVELMRLSSLGDLSLAGDLFANTLNVTSDRGAKEHFKPVDTQGVLEAVAQLPLQTWNYKTDEPETRHLGPMAQDFHAAFGLGADNKHIATVDADGVALAAIQGLNRKLEERERTWQAELNAKQSEIDALKRAVEELRRAIENVRR